MPFGPNGIGSDRLRDLVLERLELPRPPAPDSDGLRSFYAAWCRHVPFDNVRKMIALRGAADAPLPGGRARDFFESWLAHGAGGTCWPTSNALFELARSLGFEAHRVTGAMRDLGVPNHASVRVALDGGAWLLDSSMLTNVPLPLDDRVFVHDDPVFPVEVEPVGGTHLVWSDTPPNATYLPCRLHVEPVTEAEYLAAYERSRERSPFNQRLYARRNQPGQLIVLVGRTRYARTRAGVERRDLAREEVCHALRTDIGISEELIDLWVRAGGLDASFEPAAGPAPPPVTHRPPSLRSSDPQPVDRA